MNMSTEATTEVVVRMPRESWDKLSPETRMDLAWHGALPLGLADVHVADPEDEMVEGLMRLSRIRERQVGLAVKKLCQYFHPEIPYGISGAAMALANAATELAAERRDSMDHLANIADEMSTDKTRSLDERDYSMSLALDEARRQGELADAWQHVANCLAEAAELAEKASKT